MKKESLKNWSEEEIKKVGLSFLKNKNRLVQSVNQKGNFIFVNKLWCELLGYSEKEALGMNFREVISKEDLEHCSIIFHGLIAGKSYENVKVTFISKKGEKIYLEANISPVNENGKVVSTIGILRNITDKNENEQELKLFEEVTNNMSEGMYLIGLNDFKIKYTNPKFEKMFGYKSGEMIGKSVDIINAPAPGMSSKQVRDSIVSLLRKQKEWHGEVQNIKKDGTKFWCYANVSLFNHSVYGEVLVAVHTDITDSKIAKKRLEESENQFYLAMKGSNEGLWDWNIVTHEVYFSPRWKSIIGYRDDEIPNKFEEWARRIHPEDREKALGYAQEYSKGKIKGNFEHEFRIKHKNGTWVNILARAFLEKDETGKPQRIVGTHTDITERKKQEGELRNQRAFYNSIVENIPNMIFVKDAKEFRFKEMNGAGEKLLGLTKNQIIGKTLFEKFSKSQSKFFLSKDQEVINDRKILDIPEEPINTPLGEKILHTKKIPLFDEKGQPEYLLGISEDITEKKKQEEELKKLTSDLDGQVKAKTFELQKAMDQLKTLDSAKTEFLSITSHELRSPMTPMKAQLQMMLAGYLGSLNAKQTEAVEIVLRNTERLDKIIVDLLDISRIEAARLKFVFVKTNLVGEINRLIEEVKEFMPEKNIDFIIKMGKLNTIEVDPDRTMQCLRNLLTNAIKFSKPNGQIIVLVEDKNDEILFSVKDFGVGIKKEEQNRIFEPFFQAEQTIYREHQGTGLGLAIVKGIVESQNGHVGFESNEKKGSTFYFTVPKKPLIEIKPISLLFSTSKTILPQVEDVLIKHLGGRGSKDFNEIKKENLSYEGIINFLEKLADKSEIKQNQFLDIASEIKAIYFAGEKKDNSPIKWKEDWNLGFKIIDKQHKHIIELINKTYDASNKHKSQALLAKLFLEIFNFAKLHFSTEEVYFKKFNYSGAEKHMQIHKDLLLKASGLYADFNEGKDVLSDFLSFLVNWFDNHCRTYDHDYVKCFQDHGLK